uniref:Uncharacterized protein n=1 Tax=Streptomyces kanamyceticus TaxID=1967 RepID=E9KTD9_STRKN|nr:hypothetical protein Tcs_SK_055 [Streptomyces kanamyceticus]
MAGAGLQPPPPGPQESAVSGVLETFVPVLKAVFAVFGSTFV